jgi:hypothetical protein
MKQWRGFSVALLVGAAAIAFPASQALSASMAGATWYVDPGGNNATCAADDPALPCKTIQKAVNSASDGDTIVVNDGTYADQDRRPAGQHRQHGQPVPGEHHHGQEVGLSLTRACEAQRLVELSNIGKTKNTKKTRFP